MGICESKENYSKTVPFPSSKLKSENTENYYKINEVAVPSSELKELDKTLIHVSRSICKIIYQDRKATGFFIKIDRWNGPLNCLMINEHVITREMVEGKITIEVSYDCDEKKLEIQLDSDKRFIKDFIELNLYVNIVQILPTDNVNEIYF